MAFVFGVFDLYHPGHQYFLTQAKKVAQKHQCKLIAIVTKDCLVKKSHPVEDEYTRLQKVYQDDIVDIALFGDETLGDYNVFKLCKPEVICCGHDQHNLREDLIQKMDLGKIPKCPIITLDAFKPEIWSSTRLRSS